MNKQITKRNSMAVRGGETAMPSIQEVIGLARDGAAAAVEANNTALGVYSEFLNAQLAENESLMTNKNLVAPDAAVLAAERREIRKEMARAFRETKRDNVNAHIGAMAFVAFTVVAIAFGPQVAKCIGGVRIR